jgi:tetratricopeptide (TPR) repeat protein
MKRTTFVVFALLAALLLSVSAAVAAPPRPSPTSTVTQAVGLSEVSITYARPGAKGRTIFGDLEKWDAVWRTGANEATTFTLSHDAKIDGKALAAGTYSLFTLPRESGKWSVIFNKEAEQWGAFEHKEAEDALRVDVTPTKGAHREWFEISFHDLSTSSAQVVLHWQETQYGFKVEFDTATLAVDVAVKEGTENPRAAYGWAQYFHDAEVHGDKALELANIAAAAQDRYWPYALKARIHHSLGQNKEAKAAAMKAIELAPSDKFAEQANEQAAKLTEEVKGW